VNITNAETLGTISLELRKVTKSRDQKWKLQPNLPAAQTIDEDRKFWKTASVTTVAGRSLKTPVQYGEMYTVSEAEPIQTLTLHYHSRFTLHFMKGFLGVEENAISIPTSKISNANTAPEHVSPVGLACKESNDDSVTWPPNPTVAATTAPTLGRDIVKNEAATSSIIKRKLDLIVKSEQHTPLTPPPQHAVSAPPSHDDAWVIGSCAAHPIDLFIEDINAAEKEEEEEVTVDDEVQIVERGPRPAPEVVDFFSA
jgi:hypothetical protein